MVSKAEFRPPIKLEYGEFNIAVSTNNNQGGYNTNPVKMSNGFIDINSIFIPTPSYILLENITPAVQNKIYERSYYIANWFKDPSTQITHHGYLIFSRDEATNKRYYSILRDDGVWEVTLSELSDIFGLPNTTMVKKNYILVAEGAATVDANQSIYPFICGGDTLYSLVRINGVWQKTIIKAYIIISGQTDFRVENFVKPKDCVIFQNRLWYITEGPRIIITSPYSDYTGQGILAGYAGWANYMSLITTSNVEGLLKSAIDHQVFLEYEEEMLTIDKCGQVLVVGTTNAVRVLKSGDADTATIVGSNLLSFILIQANCNGAKGTQFYAMMFIPTKNGLLHRQISTVENVSPEGNESLVLRAREDTREVKRLSEDPDSHLLLGLLDDGSVVGFSPPIVHAPLGKLLAPSTSYLNLTDGENILDIFGKNNLVIQKDNDYLLFQKDRTHLPPLTFNSFEYTAKKGIWRCQISAIDVVTNIITFAANPRLSGLKGVGIIYANQFFTSQKINTDPNDYNFLSNISLSTIALIDDIILAPVDVIPETDNVLSFTGQEAAKEVVFGFLSGTESISFNVVGADGPLYLTTVDKSQILPAHDFYAGSIFSHMRCAIEWIVPESMPGMSTYKMITSNEFSLWLDVYPSNGYRNFKYHDIYSCTRSGGEPHDIMYVNCMAKSKYGLGNPKKIQINIIQ